jgi:hypothetical protein
MPEKGVERQRNRVKVLWICTDQGERASLSEQNPRGEEQALQKYDSIILEAWE